jgi:hypothetical protein
MACLLSEQQQQQQQENMSTHGRSFKGGLKGTWGFLLMINTGDEMWV